ncbi:MAG: hypothetical protein NTX24_03790 [Candidatus Pacearchaeota archaeon]|nr:hypothetical protein [Candidatus Pacearchaeota archaeon]
MDFDNGCEECGIENEPLVNTITNNRSMRLCSRCAIGNNSIVLEEEIQKQKERIRLNQLKKQQKIQDSEVDTKKPVSLNDLWDRYKKVKEEKEKKLKSEVNSSILDEKKFIEDLEIKKQQEKEELIEEINKEILPEKTQEQKAEFNTEANKKINIKDLFKKTFKLLKKQEKKEEELKEAQKQEEKLEEINKV